MESNILTYWCGDWYKLLTTVLQHSDSVLFIRRMHLTDSMIFTKSFLRKL